MFEVADDPRDIVAALLFRTPHVRMQRAVRALAPAEREVDVEVHVGKRFKGLKG